MINVDRLFIILLFYFMHINVFNVNGNLQLMVIIMKQHLKIFAQYHIVQQCVLYFNIWQNVLILKIVHVSISIQNYNLLWIVKFMYLNFMGRVETGPLLRLPARLPEKYMECTVLKRNRFDTEFFLDASEPKIVLNILYQTFFRRRILRKDHFRFRRNLITVRYQTFIIERSHRYR